MSRARLLVYAIITYVIVFLVWWSVLLLRTERKSYNAQQALVELKIKNGTLESDTNLRAVDESFSRNRRIILTEGAFFLCLLLGSGYYILKLLNKQERFTELKRNFLLGTTHELRSPIASVKLNLQTLLRKELAQENKTLLLDNSINEINRLNNLIDNILLASKIDSKEYSFQLEAVPLSSLVERGVEEAVSSGMAVQATVDPNIEVKGDRSALLIVLNNLIDNAQKYGGEAPIAISLREKHGFAVLSVADQGIGIPTKERQKVWQRFYRIEDEQVRNSKGTGLGLFLVKSMTNLMKGSVSIAQNQPKGSIFSISLPLNNT